MDDHDKIQDTELKELNDFVQANPIRNNFLPIMEHISKLKPKDYEVVEYENKDGNTSSIRFHIDAGYEYPIDGKVGYDWAEKDSKKVIFEIWWGGECYCLLYTPVQMQNMLSVLMKRVKVEGYDTYKTIRSCETVLPI